MGDQVWGTGDQKSTIFLWKWKTSWHFSTCWPHRGHLKITVSHSVAWLQRNSRVYCMVTDCYVTTTEQGSRPGLLLPSDLVFLQFLSWMWRPLSCCMLCDWGLRSRSIINVLLHHFIIVHPLSSNFAMTNIKSIDSMWLFGLILSSTI